MSSAHGARHAPQTPETFGDREARQPARYYIRGCPASFRSLLIESHEGAASDILADLPNGVDASAWLLLVSMREVDVDKNGSGCATERVSMSWMNPFDGPMLWAYAGNLLGG